MRILIKMRILGMFALVAVISIAAVAYWGVYRQSDAMNAMDERAVSPLMLMASMERELKEIRFRMAGVALDQLPTVGANNHLKEARGLIAEQWDLFRTSRQTGSETDNAIQVIDKGMVQLNAFLDDLSSAYKDEDVGAVMSLLEDGWPDIHVAIIKPMEEMVPLYQERVVRAKESVSQIEERVMMALMLVVGISLPLMVLVIATISRSVTGPTQRLQKFVHELRRTFDFGGRIAVKSKDELGQTAAGFNNLMEAMQTAIGEVNGVVSAIAVGDFSKRVEADLKGDLKVMKEAVNASAQSVQVTMDGLNGVMKALYEGDFEARMRADVAGEFKVAVDQAMQAMQAMLGDIGQVMASVAQGDLSQRVSAQGRGDLAKLKDNINRSLEGLATAMRVVNQNTRQVATAANQTSAAIGQISDGAQNQMHAINQVATAVKQTATSVTDVATNTEAASLKSQESVAIVRAGKSKMEKMVEVVNGIAANSAKINKITEVIEKIANKTNLLSLNAAIEAARAGEHGRGFAVVADEVGKLAANSAESTQEIAHLVQQAVDEANRAVETVKEVSADMDTIERTAFESDGMLQRISAALEQQNSAVQEINANVANLNKIAEANASASEEMTATVVELSKIADNTRREVDKFAV